MIDWTQYDRLKAEGLADREIARQWGIPWGTFHREKQKREGPPSTVHRPAPTVHPATDDRPPSTVDRGPLDLGAAVAAALQPLLTPLIARLEALEHRPIDEAPSTVHPDTVDRPPAHRPPSTVHPETWELRQLKHSIRWTVYVPQAMKEELQRRAGAQGVNPSLLVQEALRRYLALEE